ncbi:MAG: Zn-ribbon domain-containing OB-fold protein [Thermoproteales archaeon]|nr:Zn-ribbon domain-containing OB-fold protein [Thermoproteales archaeon]
MVKANSIPRVWRERTIKYRLIGGKCKKCGKSFYPFRRICPRCGSEEVEEVHLPREGKLLYYTVIRAPPSDFEEYAPYVVGIVELKDGTRVLAQITDVVEDQLEEGVNVEAAFRKYREQGKEGIIEYGIKFRPKT